MDGESLFSVESSQNEMEEKPSSIQFMNGLYRKPLLPNLVFVNPEPENSDEMDFEDLTLHQKARRWIAEEKA